jgi:hypothetical protein
LAIVTAGSVDGGPMSRCGQPSLVNAHRDTSGYSTAARVTHSVSLMKYAIAMATTLLLVTAVAGAVAAIMGSTDAAVLIWIVGGVASVSIVAVAPWLILFVSGEDSEG